MRKEKKRTSNNILFNKFLFFGLHLGGLKAFWNPQMKSYIAAFRNGFCILDLSLTHRCIRQGFRFLLKIILSNKKIIFIGGPRGLEKNFSALCRKYGHWHIDSYSDGLFSNFQLDKSLSNAAFRTTPSLIFFFDVSTKEKAKKELLNLNIPIMAFVNSEDDISGIDYVIPANVQSLKGGVFAYNLFYYLFSFPKKIN
jgi:small subunit ribosomal protein S2